MKVGDLVRLSARAKKQECHRRVAFYDELGIIYCFSAPWIYVKWPTMGLQNKYFRHDLKYAK
mgnify:CR=1 FL=1|tara:strand:- start:288 stop:473 length:186 start_codon:yes stop_codon:yes gene_type:complete